MLFYYAHDNMAVVSNEATIWIIFWNFREACALDWFIHIKKSKLQEENECFNEHQ